MLRPAKRSAVETCPQAGL